jgi:diguanylate cyclase (GGDEF)-like protein
MTIDHSPVSVRREKPVVEDQLTGFLTRKSISEFLAEFEHDGTLDRLSIIAVEISRFGVINDSLGTSTGDRIIATTAKRVRKLFPNALAIARLHGDHFGLVFDDTVGIEDAVNTLLDFAQRPLLVDGEVIVLSVRIGVAEPCLVTDKAVELLHAAEVALHHSKSNFAKVAYFDADMIDSARAVHQLENDLRVSLVTNAAELHQAIDNAEFELKFQPIIRSTTGQVHAFEALLRWNHPKRGVVSPALFIPMAEQIRVMTVLGNWIIRNACAQAMTWGAGRDGTRPGVSINVSPTQFLDGEILVETVRKAVEDSGIEPSRVKLEITESANFAPRMRGFLDELHGIGCLLALDDFGTGYSSIAQLNDLPLDYIKVDRSIVKDLVNDNLALDKRAHRLTRSVLALGKSLELTSIVEGIETPAQIEAVQQLGGDLIQGYVYAPPIPAADVNAFIAQQQVQETS